MSRPGRRPHRSENRLSGVVSQAGYPGHCPRPLPDRVGAVLQEFAYLIPLAPKFLATAHNCPPSLYRTNSRPSIRQAGRPAPGPDFLPPSNRVDKSLSSTSRHPHHPVTPLTPRHPRKSGDPDPRLHHPPTRHCHETTPFPYTYLPIPTTPLPPHPPSSPRKALPST